MNELLELVRIVNKQKVKSINVLTHSSGKGKLSALYDGIHSGEFSTDEEAMASLYSGDINAKESYRKLKDRLMDQLINSIFFIGHSNTFNEHQRKAYNCLKLGTATKIMRYRSAFDSSVYLGKRTLKMAMEIEQTETIVALTAILRGIASRRGDIKAFEKYNQLHETYVQIQQDEIRVHKYFDHVTLLLGRSVNSAKLIPILRNYEKELREITKPNSSAEFLTLSHLIYVNRCEVENDHKKLQDVCEEAIALLEKKGNANQTLIFAFLSKSVDTYIRFQQWEKGKIAIQRCIDIVSNPNALNWMIMMYKYILLCLYCDKIQEGYEVYSQKEVGKQIAGMGPASKEPWEMLGSYFIWFKRIGRLKINNDNEKSDSFRINKFINQLTFSAKDKEGQNTKLLVLQLLFLIQMKKYELIIDKAESIKTYLYRYIRKKSLYRTHCFIKLLLLLPENHFNKTAVIRKSVIWLDRLKANPLSEISVTLNIELVPYERLWDQVVNLLDEGFFRPRKKM